MSGHFDQSAFACRSEWGEAGVTGLAPADVIVVVDVMTFSTTVDVAVSRGVSIFPYSLKGTAAAAFAAARGAELAGPRETSRYSLSPSSFLDAPPGLRCVLPSPNGAALSVRALTSGAVVFAGCLRNATAVARAARAAGATFNVCPAGERWADDSLRPAIEDLIGAGAILAQLPGEKSPEALIAIAAFERARVTIADIFMKSSSGRELLDRGYPRDVSMAAEYDVSSAASRLHGEAFQSA